MEYTFSQHINKEDYVAFLMNHLKMNLMKPFNLILFIGGMGYLLIGPFVTGSGDFTFTLIGLALILVMIGSVFFAKRNAAKRYDQNAEMFDMTYKVTEELFSFAVGNEWIDKKWIDFYSASETDEYLYIFVAKDSGSVLIKRDIPIDALTFVKDQIKKNVPAKRVKLINEPKTTA